MWCYNIVSKKSNSSRNCGTHFIGNVLLIKLIYVYLFLSMGRLQKSNEVAQELLAIVIDILLGILADKKHLPHMTFTLYVAAASRDN